MRKKLSEEERGKNRKSRRGEDKTRSKKQKGERGRERMKPKSARARTSDLVLKESGECGTCK